MSWPTLTHTHGWKTDCTDTTEAGAAWTKTEDGNNMTFLAEDSDYLRLAVVGIGGNNISYLSWPDEAHAAGEPDIDIDCNTYTKVLFRYKCSNANVKAKIVFVFDGGPNETILVDTNTETFTVGSHTLTTTDRQIDHVRLYANAAVGIVFYDFVLIHVGTFTFPHCTVVEPDFAPIREVNIPVFGKDGGNEQNAGSNLSTIHITADMSQGSWGTPTGQYLFSIVHNRTSELWQWFTSAEHDIAFKVKIKSFRMPYRHGKLTLDLMLQEYSLASAKPLPNWSVTESSSERWGHS